MAKNKKTSELLTRKILQEELDATRKDLKVEISITKVELRGEIREMAEEMDEKNKGYRDQVLTGIDGVMKELETMREEKAAETLLLERISDRLDNHEERISNLESPAQ